MTEQHCPIIVAGGGVGGVAAALAACEVGGRVLLVSRHDWLGGQLTTQGIPPDEHRWIELCGCTQSYRAFRDAIRNYYKTHVALTVEARADPFLNPGNAWVSRLAFEPRVGAAVIDDMLAPHVDAGRLTILRGAEVVAVSREGMRVNGCTIGSGGVLQDWSCDYLLDATELGDLLPLSGTAYVTGAEAKSETGEPHALDVADPQALQAITLPFAIEHRPGEDHTIDRPATYDFWAAYAPDFWCGKLFSFTQVNPMTMKPVEATLFHDSQHRRQFPFKTGRSLREASVLWSYRRILDGSYRSDGVNDVSMVVWIQNDYWLANVVDVEPREYNAAVAAAKEQSLSLLYWLQTEAPRPDGGKGYPGLRLRKDIFGTDDGLSIEPYVRESRRIRAVTTVTENDISHELRGDRGATHYPDSVGIGMYRIDLHPDTRGRTYVDLSTCPFQIPLGALIPVETDRLLPAAKNIGTTHITNGAYRLHPVEWNIGEVAGALAAFSITNGVEARTVRDDAARLADFQDHLRARGIELEWPVFHAY